MTSASVLSLPDFSWSFIVKTDAYSVDLGAVLSQKDIDGRVHLIHFAIRAMNKAKRSYAACEQKASTVVFLLKTFCD